MARLHRKSLETVTLMIIFDGGAMWGDYHFWANPENIVRNIRREHPFPLKNVRVEDADGNTIWTEDKP